MEKSSMIRCGGRISIFIILSFLLFLTCIPEVWGDTSADSPGVDLTELSLEDLANTDVTSVSRKAERLSNACAAVYVISQEDIRRSGMTSIPELLRMVPGVDVAHIDSNKWAVSARGFNERFSKMMLVLIDGRTIYTPCFSGVFWDSHDLLLEDIERIEIIRGPGATMWGSNAVNGIINVITKNAKDTQLPLLSMFNGTEDKLINSMRLTGNISDKGFYRVYGKFTKRSAFVDDLGNDTSDYWDQSRGGFRIDLGNPDTNSTIIQGDIYRGEACDDTTYPVLDPPYIQSEVGRDVFSGGNIMGTWTRVKSPDSDATLRVSYDRSKRDGPQFYEIRNTVDVDFQHRFAYSRRQSIVWGLGARRTWDHIEGGPLFTYAKKNDSYNLIGAFIQDDIQLKPNRSRFTLGSKFEYNSYTGLETQPSIRFLYTPDRHSSYWAAVSRAVRIPSRSERDLNLNVSAFPMDGTTYLIYNAANPDFDSEKLLAYELGYRNDLSRRATIDVATFYNKYKSLRGFTEGMPYPAVDPTPHIVVPVSIANNVSGHTYGTEIALKYNASRIWDFAASYTLLKTRLRYPSTASPIPVGVEGDSPENKFNIRAHANLRKNLDMTLSLYWVDDISFPSITTFSEQNIPNYTRLDFRLGWKRNDSTYVTFGVRNLLDSHHPEFGSFLGERANEVPRSFYGSASISF